jgi:hypothetical protein
MARLGHHGKLGLGPGAGEILRRANRAYHIVAALHDETGDVAHMRDAVDQRSRAQKDFIDEIMRLNACQTERYLVAAKIGKHGGMGLESGAGAFPAAPGMGRWHVHGGVGVA